MNLTPSIASDIEKLVQHGLLSNESEIVKAACHVEVYLATFTPNHLDESEINH